MVSTTNILVTLLSLAATISGALIGRATASVQTPPTGVSITVISSSWPGCSPSHPAAVQLLEQGQSLSFQYDGFTAFTDVTESSSDRSCSVVVNFVYPEGYTLGVQNPVFQGNTDVAEGATAEIRAYSLFSASDSTVYDIDEAEVAGPFTGNYSLTGSDSSARTQSSACGSGSTTLKFATRLNALGGIPNPYPANATIQHNATTVDLVWTPC
ncbi:uncharacterized protein LY89DRAFT_743669 [Mollisia scopiformis]|uniref:Uncharacterized protein n=1 Tax=Mollisia scopiformis TaxID=149040 RepID=A0A132B2B4_MOLSC|nr:uncharacterized protein LY89DRAFT_743669 [Mollisia scopiformis]KUJ06522.1 hypothetical protein LY89DRAFT_743669 [Mollisia scopiformis]